MRDRLHLERQNLPCRAEVVLGGAAFALETHYNSRTDQYVVHLYKDGALVCAGEALVYGMPLWGGFAQAGLYPPLRLVPLDEAGEASEVNRRSFGAQVFLTVDDEAGEAGR